MMVKRMTEELTQRLENVKDQVIVKDCVEKIGFSASADSGDDFDDYISIGKVTNIH